MTQIMHNRTGERYHYVTNFFPKRYLCYNWAHLLLTIVCPNDQRNDIAKKEAEQLSLKIETVQIQGILTHQFNVTQNIILLEVTSPKIEIVQTGHIVTFLQCDPTHNSFRSNITGAFINTYQGQQGKLAMCLVITENEPCWSFRT